MKVMLRIFNNSIIKLILLQFISYSFIVSCASTKNDRQNGGINQATINQKIIFFDFSKSKEFRGLEDFLQDIKIDSLKKYVAINDLKQLEYYLEEYSKQLANNDFYHLAFTVENIRQIIPTDPYFRVVEMVFKNNLTDEYKNNQYKIVQVIRWDWDNENTDAKVYINTFDESGKPVVYGPFKNNIISMLEKPIRKSFSVSFEDFNKVYPRTFRIGWTLAKYNKEKGWEPLTNFAEYDPFFRINVHGGLEY